MRQGAGPFGVLEPLGGTRWLKVTEQRTKTEFAAWRQHVADVLYPHAVTIRVVLDTPIPTRLEFHFTPKHGSLLNAALTVFAVLSRQCLERRIDTLERLRNEVEAWLRKRNRKRRGVKWRFITDDARRKRPRRYPTPLSTPS